VWIYIDESQSPLVQAFRDARLSLPGPIYSIMGRGSGPVAKTARAPIITILFTDLVDSTALMQLVDDERAQKLPERHHQLLWDAVSAHGGSELQWLGDRLMVAFASRLARGWSCT